jgi:hypothetical protein
MSTSQRCHLHPAFSFDGDDRLFGSSSAGRIQSLRRVLYIYIILQYHFLIMSDFFLPIVLILFVAFLEWQHQIANKRVFAARALSCVFVQVSDVCSEEKIASAGESQLAIRSTEGNFELVREMLWRLCTKCAVERALIRFVMYCQWKCHYLRLRPKR